MKWVLALTLVATEAALSYAAAPVKAKSTANKSSKAKPVSRPAVHGRAATRTRRARAAPAPSYQLHPDPERYQEIQKALNERGYFTGQVNGEWGDDSVDALKRFQAAQNLPADGKVNALTLIGLGLGPKHDGIPAGAAAAVPDSVPTAAPAPATPASTPSVSSSPSPMPRPPVSQPQ